MQFNWYSSPLFSLLSSLLSASLTITPSSSTTATAKCFSATSLRVASASVVFSDTLLQWAVPRCGSCSRRDARSGMRRSRCWWAKRSTSSWLTTPCTSAPFSGVTRMRYGWCCSMRSITEATVASGRTRMSLCGTRASDTGAARKRDRSKSTLARKRMASVKEKLSLEVPSMGTADRCASLSTFRPSSTVASCPTVTIFCPLGTRLTIGVCSRSLCWFPILSCRCVGVKNRIRRRSRRASPNSPLFSLSSKFRDHTRKRGLAMST